MRWVGVLPVAVLLQRVSKVLLRVQRHIDHRWCPRTPSCGGVSTMSSVMCAVYRPGGHWLSQLFSSSTSDNRSPMYWHWLWRSSSALVARHCRYFYFTGRHHRRSRRLHLALVTATADFKQVTAQLHNSVFPHILEGPGFFLRFSRTWKVLEIGKSVSSWKVMKIIAWGLGKSCKMKILIVDEFTGGST